MLYFSYPQIVLQEVPDEISLALSISGCPMRCKGCHSPETRDKYFGKPLTIRRFRELIETNKFISCVLFYGGEWEYDNLLRLIKITKDYNLKAALYSGRNYFINDLWDFLDYYKIGEYKEELGALNSINTNQHFFKKENGNIKDITYVFQREVKSSFEKKVSRKVNVY